MPNSATESALTSRAGSTLPAVTPNAVPMAQPGMAGRNAPRFLKTGYGASGATYYDWQGYDVHKNRLYYTEGQSNYNLFGSFYSGSSFAYVTVFDFEGNIVEERTQVAVVLDKDKLTQIGVSVFGTFEAEGIKVCKDKLYLGYTARGITADNTKHYQNIFVFDPSSK